MIHAKNGKTFVQGNGEDLMAEFATIVSALNSSGIPSAIIKESVDIGLKYAGHPDITTVNVPYAVEERDDMDSFERIFGKYFHD